jgi:hypothetical protein
MGKETLTKNKLWRKYHLFLEIYFWQKSFTVPNETAPLPYTPGKLTLLLKQCTCQMVALPFTGIYCM